MIPIVQTLPDAMTPMNAPGTVTPWLGKLASLKILLLDHNALSGILPKSVENLCQLEVRNYGALRR